MPNTTKPTTTHPPGRRLVSAKTRARVLELAGAVREDGSRWSRNAVAKECGISPATVSKIVRAELGEDFSWSAAAPLAAVAAHADDMKVQRGRLAEDSLSEAARLLGLMSAPHEVIHWDKDGFMHRGEIERPTSGDVKNYAIAIGVLTDKHLTLIRADSDDRDMPAVDAWMAHMMGRTA